MSLRLSIGKIIMDQPVFIKSITGLIRGEMGSTVETTKIQSVFKQIYGLTD